MWFLLSKISTTAYHSYLENRYYHYFQCQIGDQDKNWAPHNCCKTCYNGLIDWLNGRRNSISFAVPMVWREPRDHITDCYFCLTDISGFTGKNKNKIVYPNLLSAIRPIPHSPDLPVPNPPNIKQVGCSKSDISAEETDNDEEMYEGGKPSEPHLINQGEFNDLIRDLNLSKDQSELLGSRLQQWNLLHSDVRISHTRKRNDEFASFFSYVNQMCFCHNVDGLFCALHVQHNPSE